MSKRRIIISGGGTGGHIFPAIAIANALKEKLDDPEILFVGALGRMEMTKVPEAGYKIVGLPIAGLQRRLTLKNLSFPFKLMNSLRMAKTIVKSFQPDVAVGVGGYASGPMLRMAFKLGVPTLIQEQNSYAGITNKLLGKNANKICVAHPGMEKFFPKNKIIITGNPVRKSILIKQNKEEALKHFGLNSSYKTLLIIGGSLGAKTINEGILNSLPELNKMNIQIIWQTGKTFENQATEALNNFSNNRLVSMAFIKRMDFAYAAADVVISRAGALSISELSIVGKPTIFIPSPNVAEDHQTKNAMTLVNEKAAILLPDVDAKDKILETVKELIASKDKMEELSLNIKKMAHPDADDKIADEVINLINTNTK